MFVDSDTNMRPTQWLTSWKAVQLSKRKLCYQQFIAISIP
ncbi:hypothetical protein ACU8KH_00377 [Lachancea thermotolerans]